MGMWFEWNYNGKPNPSLHDARVSDYVLCALALPRDQRAILAHPCADFSYVSYEWARWEGGRWWTPHNKELQDVVAWTYIPWPDPCACGIPDMTDLCWPYQEEYMSRVEAHSSDKGG